MFAIPYEHDFTLIGTTDVDYHDDPARVHIDAAETDYLCALANRYFRQQLGAADVVWSWSGVRPLLADEASDPMSVTRDYALELDPRARAAPVRVRRQDHHLPPPRRGCRDSMLAAHLGRHAAPWTAAPSCRAAICPRAASRCSCAPSSAATRGCRRGCGCAVRTPTARVSSGCSAAPRHSAIWAREILPQLYERELEYLCREEFARSAEDILWRRSKLGLHLLGVDSGPLQRWLEAYAASRGVTTAGL